MKLKLSNPPDSFVKYWAHPVCGLDGLSHSIWEILILQLLLVVVEALVVTTAVVAVADLPTSLYKWYPAFIPHKTGGFLPDGLVIVNLSVHAPVTAVTPRSKAMKSNLSMQMSEFIVLMVYVMVFVAAVSGVGYFSFSTTVKLWLMVPPVSVLTKKVQQIPNPDAHFPELVPPLFVHSVVLKQVPLASLAAVVVGWHSSFAKLTTEKSESTLSSRGVAGTAAATDSRAKVRRVTPFIFSANSKN